MIVDRPRKLDDTTEKAVQLFAESGIVDEERVAAQIRLAELLLQTNDMERPKSLLNDALKQAKTVGDLASVTRIEQLLRQHLLQPSADANSTLSERSIDPIFETLIDDEAALTSDMQTHHASAAFKAREDEGELSIEAERASLRRQIAQHKLNRNRLRERAAKHGIDASISLLNQIDDEEREIERIEQELQELEGRA